MKKIRFLFVLFGLFHGYVFAQHPITMRHLWVEPQVHVMFNGYAVSFTIKDINKALAVAESIGDSTFGDARGLDSAKQYTFWLNDPQGGVGSAVGPSHAPMMLSEKLQTNRFSIESLLQNGVGAYLISIGHAEIRNKRHKKLKEIIMDAGTVEFDASYAKMNFYDPKRHQLIFSGKMNVDMYKKDIGLDM